MEVLDADVCIIGSGMAGLSAACMLAKKGLKPIVLEQNWQPGGCSSSYWRKGFVFETGATTLVGLDKNMPLRALLDHIGIDFEARRLALPMQVHLGGECISRYGPIDEWIAEAERVFGRAGQADFWVRCKQISDFVWQSSGLHTGFPPETFKDLLAMASGFRFNQLRYGPYSLVSTAWLMKKYGLQKNEMFVRFADAQLLIAAQNTTSHVNALFGAAALCYTNFGNYYSDGGLLPLANCLGGYVESQGGRVILRTLANQIQKTATGYIVKSDKLEVRCRFVIGAIPAQAAVKLFEKPIKKRLQLLEPDKLWGAFQVGIGFRPSQKYQSLHHQIHLDKPLSDAGASTIFLSLSHPEDRSRTDIEGLAVGSVSAHIHNPHLKKGLDKQADLDQILDTLNSHGLITKEQIIYRHCSGVREWEKWTKRPWGAVGGYPQSMQTPVWQMNGARLDRHGAYLCGDTTYPGQGIPGATLSGIIAAKKLCRDWNI